MIENTVDVVSFLSKASAEDIASIETAIKVRKDFLTAQRVDSLTPGMTVRLQGLRPKYLNGLSGEISHREQGRGNPRVAVLLTEASTKAFERAKGLRPGTERYLLTGVPSVCLIP